MRQRDTVRLVYAGPLEKGPSSTVLGAYAEVARRFPEVSLVILAEGHAAVPAGASALPRVTVFAPTPAEDLAAVLGRCDVLLLPAGSDADDGVVRQACAFGLPALVTGEVGARRLVADGKTGFAVRRADREGWLRAIVRCLALIEYAPSAWQRMRALCRHAA
ncbi:MAG: glycosyltransferase [Coriobacteriia bacterium]|nr:glycosyltransferase [Coriobacteriia bacterium]